MRADKMLRNREEDMAGLEEAAKRLHAWVESDKNEFQRRARLLQSIWRENKGYGMGIFGDKKLGSRLAEDDAKEGHNFLSKNIWDEAERALENRQDGQLISPNRLLTNLLSSQPLCFNLFGELAASGRTSDLNSATKIFSELMGKPLRSVTHLEFEKSPGRSEAAFLGDRTAFDFYVEYELQSGVKGFLGIEVKYHENLVSTEYIDKDGLHGKTSSRSESVQASAVQQDFRPNKRYMEVADQSRWFNKASYPALGKSPLVQIWRDHLLAASMLQPKGEQYLLEHRGLKFAEGFYAIIYPKQNVACSKAAKDYRSRLIRKETFFDWTLEQVHAVFKKFMQGKWLEEFERRYLDFTQIDALVD